MKHIVCYSGGHSSGLVAVEVVRRFGAENVVLLNHDISANVEHADVKRFKQQVADYLQLPITYANIGGLPADALPDQIDVVLKAKAFKVRNGAELCTSRLKTEPFDAWLAKHVPDKDCVIYYGFDSNERVRIQRRSSILAAKGFRSDYPLALWADRTITQTIQVGINPPMQYAYFKHANCVGCLKAGKQHWYIVYCVRPKLYQRASDAEDVIGYTILPDASLAEMAPIFERMKQAGVPQTEHIPHQRFWADVRRLGIDTAPDKDVKPCECVL